MPRLSGALAAITAAVGGVMLNLSIWFSAHVFFGSVGELQWGLIAVIQPLLATFDPIAASIALTAIYLLLFLKQGIGRTLAFGAIAGMLAGQLLT